MRVPQFGLRASPSRPGTISHTWSQSVVATLLVIVASLVTGCQSTATLPPGSATVRLSDGRRDATVKMPGFLHVELIGHAGTGFDWRVAAYDPSLLEPVGTPHVTPLDPGVMGGRTITTFQFRALRTGETTVVFESVRPSEWNEPPGKTAQVEAKVTG